MRCTCLLIGLLFFTFLPARAGHSPPKVVLRVHVQTTGEGLSPQEATTITIPPNGEQIQVRTLPEVTEGEIVDVQQDASGLHLKFNHEGQVDLSVVTAQNQGRILVVLIDGYVIYAPIIDEQITNGELDIPSAHPVPAQIVQLLQEIVQKNVRQAAKA
jgi:preprotein translocase subunit SecD